MNLHHGDCLDVMATMDPDSVDAIVTDPPYGLGFMGKVWDSPGAFVERKARLAAEGFDGVGGNHHPTSDADIGRTRLSENVKAYGFHFAWAEAAYRVARPSAYLLAFGGTRTVHRMTCALEDAGWIIRDMLVWGYASGFPKSKASLKPAWEPIVMARKPGPLRMLAIDECRIGVDGGTTREFNSGWTGTGNLDEQPRRHAIETLNLGRWPANIVLTDPIFDGGIAGVVGGGEASQGSGWAGAAPSATDLFTGVGGVARENYGDTGTYSRFFLIPKAARSDREPVLGGLPTLPGRPLSISQWEGQTNGSGKTMGPSAPRQNVHPTVKPVDLMRHLVRLVTPTGGTVLDPFLGSGTTALAAEMEGFPWIGIEREAEYVAIAEARLNGTQRGLGLEA